MTKQLNKYLAALYAASSPLRKEKHTELFQQLEEICTRNALDLPELRTTNWPRVTLAADVKNNCIYINESFLSDISPKYIACLVAHEMAHFILKHKGIQPKENEYLVDRIAAALVGDETLYKDSLSALNEWVEAQKEPYYALAKDLTGLGGWLLRLEIAKGERQEKKIYGTPDERLANTQYDIDRREIVAQALPLALQALQDPQNPNAAKLKELAAQFHLEDQTIERLVQNALRAGDEHYPAANRLASFISTNVMQQQKETDKGGYKGR